MEKLLLTPAEVAQAIGIGRSKAYELIASGQLPAIKVGKKGVRVSLEHLRAWIAAQVEATRQVTDSDRG